MRRARTRPESAARARFRAARAIARSSRTKCGPHALLRDQCRHRAVAISRHQPVHASPVGRSLALVRRSRDAQAGPIRFATSGMRKSAKSSRSAARFRTSRPASRSTGHGATAPITSPTTAYARERLLPEGADPRIGIFSHIGAVALNGVHDAQIRIGDTVAVFGLGVPGSDRRPGGAPLGRNGHRRAIPMPGAAKSRFGTAQHEAIDADRRGRGDQGDRRAAAAPTAALRFHGRCRRLWRKRSAPSLIRRAS